MIFIENDGFVVDDSFLPAAEARSRLTMLRLFSSIFLTLLSIHASHQHSHGAPMSRCYDLRPMHGGFQPQELPSHYKIVASEKVIGNGQKMKVEILSTDEDRGFNGFMMQARTTGDPFVIVGRFVESQESDYNFRPCTGPHSTVTNANNNTRQIMTFEWSAPVDFTGIVKFR